MSAESGLLLRATSNGCQSLLSFKIPDSYVVIIWYVFKSSIHHTRSWLCSVSKNLNSGDFTQTIKYTAQSPFSERGIKKEESCRNVSEECAVWYHGKATRSCGIPRVTRQQRLCLYPQMVERVGVDLRERYCLPSFSENRCRHLR